MQTVPLQLSDVIYNAANQSFEALVTVHDASGARSYACAIDAPITMEFEDAARGLSTQALRRHTHGHADSVRAQTPPVVQRAGRLAGLRRLASGQFRSGQQHAA